jgi:hypothetical protein
MKKIIHSSVSEFLVIIRTPSFTALARGRRKESVKVLCSQYAVSKRTPHYKIFEKKNYNKKGFEQLILV